MTLRLDRLRVGRAERGDSRRSPWLVPLVDRGGAAGLGIARFGRILRRLILRHLEGGQRRQRAGAAGADAGLPLRLLGFDALAAGSTAEDGDELARRSPTVAHRHQQALGGAAAGHDALRRDREADVALVDAQGGRYEPRAWGFEQDGVAVGEDEMIAGDEQVRRDVAPVADDVDLAFPRDAGALDRLEERSRGAMGASRSGTTGWWLRSWWHGGDLPHERGVPLATRGQEGAGPAATERAGASEADESDDDVRTPPLYSVNAQSVRTLYHTRESGESGEECCRGRVMQGLARPGHVPPVDPDGRGYASAGGSSLAMSARCRLRRVAGSSGSTGSSSRICRNR